MFIVVIITAPEKMVVVVGTHLSATAPDTMVVAVVANDSWKKKVVYVSPILSSAALRKKSPHPQKKFAHDDFPKDNPYPNIQYVMPPRITSTTFFTMMLVSFFSETQPLSSKPNPMRNVIVIVVLFKLLVSLLA